MEEKLKAFERLLTIMDELREKCPWDSKQTIESLRYLTLEETYELSDAIIEGNRDDIRKELGDIMLHLVFYAKIGSEEKAFDIADVINGICDKLVHRHPHIYGNVEVADEDDVKNNWEKIKIEEGEGRQSVLEGVPKSLPALVKAFRIQEKVRGVGFDWDNKDQVWNKVLEEMNEMRSEIDNGGDKEKIEGEFGDLLFALINYARFIDVNPEDALSRTNRKFIKRFQILEEKIREEGKDLREMNLEEMDVFWEAAKKEE